MEEKVLVVNMTTQDAKKLLGVKAMYIDEEELVELIISLSNLADIFLEQSEWIVNVRK